MSSYLHFLKARIEGKKTIILTKLTLNPTVSGHHVKHKLINTSAISIPKDPIIYLNLKTTEQMIQTYS